MKFDTHGDHYPDLYVLPETEEEAKKIITYLNTQGFYYQWSFSNVKSQDWYGKRFIEIPFMGHLKSELEKL